ncbi:DUF6573 family protein [Kribbella sp. NPDC059898]|uniref:DUF6573 family protein n=1 Tax=Kribbella sp. NPDC059898 TaxID=3346995 RepID=UPI0036511808
MQTPSESNDRMRELIEFYGEPISIYTMAQGIADGALVEAGDMAKELFAWPILLTAAAWADCVAWNDEDTERTGAYGQSVDGRLWDVLWMTRCAVQAAARKEDTNQVAVQLYRIARNQPRTEEPEAQLAHLQATLAGHDDGSPVLVIGLPGED